MIKFIRITNLPTMMRTSSITFSDFTQEWSRSYNFILVGRGFPKPILLNTNNVIKFILTSRSHNACQPYLYTSGNIFNYPQLTLFSECNCLKLCKSYFSICHLSQVFGIFGHVSKSIK